MACADVLGEKSCEKKNDDLLIIRQPYGTAQEQQSGKEEKDG